jgi:hypothetical protein
MKQKIYILGLITCMVTFAGAIIKVNHWPGASILLGTGIGCLVLFFIPLALADHYKAQEKREDLSLYIVTWLTCFVVFSGMLFKINHWPHAGTFLLIALPFPYIVFLPVFLWVTSKNRNFNIYNLVFVLSLLAFNSVFSSLLSLNVSKTRIDDSYNLSLNYSNLQKALQRLPEVGAVSVVDAKIGEVIAVINEYREIILNSEGISVEEWTTRPGNLKRPDIGAGAGIILEKIKGPQFGEKLENELRGLIRVLENTKGCETLSREAPLILGYTYPEDNESTWVGPVFIYTTLPWSMIYLDALETNLSLIKAALPRSKETV